MASVKDRPRRSVSSHPSAWHLRAVSAATSAWQELIHAGRFEARVAFVFRSALNLEPTLPATLPLVGLVGERAGNMPGAILVEEGDGLDWFELPVRPGMPAIVEGTILKIGKSVEVDLDPVSVWDARQSLPPTLWTDLHVRASLERVAKVCAMVSSAGLGVLHQYRAELLGRKRMHCTALPPMVRLAMRRIVSLTEGLRAGDSKRAVEAARSLVGLGIGLTPSGDDLLLGLFGTFHLLAPATGLPPTVADVAAALASFVPGNTSKVSQVFLLAALRGEVSESLADFVGSVIGARPNDPLSVNRLLSHGSSSGAEIALGSLLGVELFLETRTGDGGSL